MATKLQLISELAENTVKKLSDYDNWTAFLRSVAWQYKYSFEDQVLIFAQRPDATACADFEMWNEKVHRRIKRGAKGIALLREQNDKYFLDYIFDVSDTYDPVRNTSLPLWRYDEKYDDAIIETLENVFGELKVTTTMTDAIICASHNAAQDNKSDYLSELKYAKENSFLEDFDEINIDTRFQSILSNSVAYIIMSRMGLQPEYTFEKDDFQNIVDFNTPETITILGNAVSDISEQALREISQTIRAEAIKSRTENKNFAKTENEEYNVDTVNKQDINDERNDNYDRANLQNSERNRDTELNSTTERNDDREIRTDEEEILEAESQEPILINDDKGDASITSIRDRQDSERTDRADGTENGESRGRERADESRELNEVDGNDEQLPPFSRRGSSQTISAQLNLFDIEYDDSNIQENMQREAARLRGAAFSIPQEIIDIVLADGSNRENSKLRICTQYKKQKSLEDNVDFLKNEYGKGGKGFIIGDRQVSAWFDEKGINIQYGKENTERGYLLSWEDAAKRVGELLDLGMYMPQIEIAKAGFNERKEIAQRIWIIFRDSDNRDLLDEMKQGGGAPTEEARIAEALANPKRRDEIADALNELISDPEQFDKLSKYYLESPTQTAKLLDELSIPRKMFTTNEYAPFSGTRFITQNEIDSVLTRGSGVESGKMRILSYFLRESDSKKRADFLKEEYGIGGGTHAMNGVGYEDHDAKGLQLKRGDISKPYDTVTLSWPQVAKCIDYLIKNNKYASRKDIEFIPEYERKQISTAIYTAFSNVPMDRYKPYPQGFDRYAAIPIISEAIKDDEKVSEITNELQNLLMETPKDDRMYPHIENALNGIQNYADRTYNLFPGIERIDNSIDAEKINIEKEVTELPFKEYFDKLHSEDDGKTVILFPLGDFYESYGDDAKNVAEVLDIFVAVKVIEGEKYDLCGFPKDRLENNVNKLNDNGYDVILVDENRNSFKVISTEKALSYNEKEVEIIEENYDNEYSDDEFASIYGGDTRDSQRQIEEDMAESEGLKVQNVIPEFEKVKPTKVANTMLYPEIPMTERKNFVITDDELGYGGAKEKFRHNMEAIRVLKECEFDHRLATPEEQEILSQYVGWGGLADAFDETKSNWADEFKELYTALTPEEYEQARASTLNAHYTSPVIIKAMYKALGNMGFTQGNILEPSCGIGNFMGLVPDSMSDSKIYGIEIDSITGRIAQQLYQQNSIAIQGFEDTSLPDSFFDVAIGNVPFGDYKINDKKYNKHNFLIHDFFFAKTLDKVRPGGIVAFITSSGTMDKRNSKVRQYIAQRADLVGAIRLPNNAFLKNAGTEVTADILFLQKRDRMTDIMPEWVNLGTLENGITVNQYFVDNPDMILGEMQMVSGPFGQTQTCVPYENIDLAEQLNDAVSNINATITEYEIDDISNDEDMSIPADPNVKNFSFTIVDGDIYFRENSIMRKVELNATAENRIKGMIGIRDCVRDLIEYQTEGYTDYEIKAQQEKLNTLYDDFTNKYGLINSRGNAMAFSDDSSYFLLCSLEIVNENGELERKADMFTKRTIGAKNEVTKVDTASEALAVSLGEKAKIDMEFMSELTGKSEDELYEDLKGVIFLNPHYEDNNIYEPKYFTADEYLSGNVREKLSVVKLFAVHDETFSINVDALSKVQPKDLTASEITVRLGTTWIPQEYIKDFVFELLSPNWYARSSINVLYSGITGEWNITNKSYDKGVKATNTYGTNRINAYKIIEETLNLKDVRIFDYVENEKGNKVAVLNKKETTIAQQKQDLIKSEFDNWIWKDPDRREKLTKLYNECFNSVRPREYDGSHITFNGMNPEIALRKHQQDAVARIMYGGNSLLGHVVGAGKTWTMVAAAMEMKRLGLCNKSLFVVPNHLTEQWASEFLQLYPAANILVATKKDFETKNRKKFCGRIATGDYDAVIIGHSQFEKIPMSQERQRAILERQLEEIVDGIIEAKANRAERYTVKQLEKSKRSIENKLDKLNDQSRKDDVVTFEELGVDRLFVDEAHYYKNSAKRCV